MFLAKACILLEKHLEPSTTTGSSHSRKIQAQRIPMATG
jgi:hypothetical protein